MAAADSAGEKRLNASDTIIAIHNAFFIVITISYAPRRLSGTI
jgi:hypothetical protein